MNRKIKKVLRFIPPAFTFKDSVDVNPLPPLGLGYPGAVIENAGIEVKIVNCLLEGWHERVDVAENIVRIGSSDDSSATSPSNGISSKSMPITVLTISCSALAIRERSLRNTS
jgi:hypothetical protein